MGLATNAEYQDWLKEEAKKHNHPFEEGGPINVDCSRCRHIQHQIMLESNVFSVKDSGQRKQFASGMVRDTAEGKIDYTRVLDGPMLDRWAAHLTKAEAKYPDVTPGVANWTLANGPEEMERFRKSAFRHFRQWLRGDTDEDHAAAVIFNLNGYEYVKARMKERAEKAA